MDQNLDIAVARSEQAVASSFSARGAKRGFLRSRIRDWHDFQDYWSDSVNSSGLVNAKSVYDAWLLASAAQVGQVILTLPATIAQMGVTAGVIFMLIYGVLGCWSVYLLTWLYFQVKYRLENQVQTAGVTAVHGVHGMHGIHEIHARHIFQYHEIMGHVAGVWYGRVTFFFNIGALSLAAVIQLIASASDLYYINSNLNKQTWTVVVGFIGLLSVVIPSYRQFRLGAVIAVLGTTIAAVYMTGAALSHGQVANVRHTGPTSAVKFFTGATNILFTFGGHGVTIEIMEAMQPHDRHKFRFIYILVVLYTFCVTLPSSISVYWAYGDTLLENSNAIAVLPESGWRTFALVAILMHQLMAFIVFVHPVYLVVEKAFRVHTRNFGLRILVRLPVLAIIWFVAIAIPFFGPINSVMGALLVSIGVYIIPAVVFNRVFSRHEMRIDSVVRISERHADIIWRVIFAINWLVVLWVVVVGFILGAWGSLTTLVRQISNFGFFDKCYQC